MNFTQMKKILPILLKHDIPPFIWGMPGIGKTQGVKQVADSMGYGLITLHLSTQEVGDLVGLQQKMPDGTVIHLRPNWMPKEGKYIIFLDEFNRAPNEVLQVMLPFTQSKTIHTHRLPNECKIVCAGNYQSNLFNVTDLSDAALLSRMCHLDFQPTKEEFTIYADSIGANMVANFIRTYPEMLCAQTKDRLDTSKIKPNQRSWLDFVFPLDKDNELGEDSYEVFSGIVGPAAAASYIAFKIKAFERINARDVLNNFRSVKEKIIQLGDNKNQRFDILNSISDEILQIGATNGLDANQVLNFKEFLLSIPLELGLKIINILSTTKNTWCKDIVNDVKFVSIFSTHKLNKKYQ